MEFSWTKALWKSVKSALVAALAVAVTAGTIDIFFDTLHTGLTPIIPVWSIPVVFALLTLARNFLKQWAKSAK